MHDEHENGNGLVVRSPAPRTCLLLLSYWCNRGADAGEESRKSKRDERAMDEVEAAQGDGEAAAERYGEAIRD